MKIENYKAYMERVKTTAEMDERILNHLKNSATNEGISNKKMQQQETQHKPAFLYQLSVAVVCFLIVFGILKFYTGINPSDGNLNARKDVQPAVTSAETETNSLSLGTPHFTNLYGKEIGSHAIQHHYIDEDNHIRICIQEMISDECVTEILGYFEAKDELGKKWLKESTQDYGFDLMISLTPAITKYHQTTKNLCNELGNGIGLQYGSYQTEQLRDYNTSKKTYFVRCCNTSPDFQTNQFVVGYKLYNIYNETAIAVTEQMKSETYPLENVKKTKGKHYQPSEVVLSPLGGILINGKDLGIKAGSKKTADNFSDLQLNLQGTEHTQTIPLITDEVWRGMGSSMDIDGFSSGIWLPNILSEKHKKALNMEYSLLIGRLKRDIDTSRVISIQIDDATYPLKK